MNETKKGLLEGMGDKMRSIAESNKASQKKVTDDVNKILETDNLVQSTISRYYNGETDPSVSFLYAFCKTFGVSSDYILGLNTHAIDSKIVTPQIVLNNLALLLNQFNFNIEFNDNHSKAMLTTDDEHMIKFLHIFQATKQYTMQQIEDFCQNLDLVMFNNNFKSKEQYYVDIMCGGIEEIRLNCFYLIDEDEQFRKPLLKEIGEDIYAPLTLEEIYKIKWHRFNSEEKDKIIKAIEENKDKSFEYRYDIICKVEAAMNANTTNNNM